jgi:outer membrane protein TolC
MSTRFAAALLILALLGAGGVVRAQAQETPPAAPEPASPEPALPPAPAPPPAGPVLTLEAAVAQALERNDRLIGVYENLAQADLSVKLARSEFRPKLTPNILGSFGQTNAANQTYQVDLSQKLTTGTELRASVAAASNRDLSGTFYNTDMRVSLSQPLLRGFGRAAARRGLSSAEARLADLTRERALAEQQVSVEVAAAYYRIVSQKQMLVVAQKTLERSQGLLEASNAKLEIGKVSQLDVFRARQLVAQAESQLLGAEGAFEDAKDQLRILLRREADYEFEVENRIPTENDSLDLAEAIETALATRLELTSATEALAETERTVSYNRNQLLPEFNLNLDLIRQSAGTDLWRSFALRDFDFAPYFRISMPVDRTPQTIQYHSALIERDRRRREIESLRRQITEQVRRAVRLQARLARELEVAGVSVEFAEKEAEVATLRYQRGLSNNLDVVNAEEALLSARSRRISLLADMAVARLSLRVALGTLNPRTDFVRRDEPAAAPQR